MNTKITKFILKTLLLFPFGFGIWTLFEGMETFNWVFSTLMGFGFAFSIMFWNVFDYEKHDDINVSDFLESSHSLVLENTAENWNHILEVLNNPLLNIKVIEKSEDSIKIQLVKRLFDSILTAEKTKNSITIHIEKKDLLKFLPDNAQNYRTLKGIAGPLKATLTTA